MIDSQKPGCEELYHVFYKFFLDSIGKDSSPWNKMRLHLMTQFFDDLALYKVINPVIIRIQTNPEERRAIARAALWDAIFAHHNTLAFRAYQNVELKEPQPVAVVTVPEYVNMDGPVAVLPKKKGRPAGKR